MKLFSENHSNFKNTASMRSPIVEDKRVFKVIFALNILAWHLTAFEIHRKSLIQHCEPRLHFERAKVYQKCQK